LEEHIASTFSPEDRGRRFPETLVTTYMAAQCHNQEDHNLNFHCLEYFKAQYVNIICGSSLISGYRIIQYSDFLKMKLYILVVVGVVIIIATTIIIIIVIAVIIVYV
jgi:hypothetical protein